MTLVEDFVANAEAVGCHVHRGAQPDLLPDVHVTLLPEDRILPGLDELFAALGNDLPSALAIVTGPSRSADIEQKLAVGVHGPREVHVVLLPSG